MAEILQRVCVRSTNSNTSHTDWYVYYDESGVLVGHGFYNHITGSGSGMIPNVVEAQRMLDAAERRLNHPGRRR